jgi:hypothetical protein
MTETLVIGVGSEEEEEEEAEGVAAEVVTESGAMRARELRPRGVGTLLAGADRSLASGVGEPEVEADEDEDEEEASAHS